VNLEGIPKELIEAAVLRVLTATLHVCRDKAGKEESTAPSGPDPSKPLVAFLFPGQGSQVMAGQILSWAKCIRCQASQKRLHENAARSI